MNMSELMNGRIRRCSEEDTESIFLIINDAATAYEGVIPSDCYSHPYMPMDELLAEIADGVEFWGYEVEDRLAGVMGIQDVRDVTLIRHAYVMTSERNRGIGSALLSFLRGRTDKPVLMGTWRDATWAIRFYEKHGFRTLTAQQSAALLSRYWKISDRQIETSVVLAEEDYPESLVSPNSGRITP